MKKILVLIIFLQICLGLFSSTHAFDFERRKKQFNTTPGYLLLPAPWSIPGIGTGLMVLGYAGNVMETPADFNIIRIGGDVEATVMRATEVFIVPYYLYLEVVSGRASKFGFNVYSSRGMDSEKDDFNIFVGEKGAFNNYSATLTFWERRLNFTLRRKENSSQVTEIKDSKGESITKLNNPIKQNIKSDSFELNLDFTDDYADPRQGISLRAELERFDQAKEGNPEFDVLTYTAALYIPILDTSTWVFNFMQSNASVRKKGNTDLESLKEQNDFAACQNVSNRAACEAPKLRAAKNQLAANKNGTAISIGGPERLRSYPLSRYRAAHARFYGTEFRWNIATDKTLFDYVVVSDVNQATQLAFFWEQASVSEESEDLGKIVRTSYGAGYRIVTGSGNVYRFDLSTGDEGTQFVIFFQYPWKRFFS